MINVLLNQIKLENKLWKNNALKISAPTWEEKFELPYGTYSVSDIQDYFEYIIKKHGPFTDRTYSKSKRGMISNQDHKRCDHTRYDLKPETKILLRNTKSMAAKDKNG